MGYVVGLGLKNPELKILSQSDIRLLRYEMSKYGKSTTFFIFFKVQLTIWRLIIYAKKTENKSLWRDEMSYGSDTWYMIEYMKS